MDSIIESKPEKSLETVTPLDILEAEIFKQPQVYCPLVHRFTPNLYTREIFMPAGTVVTSVKHLTRHPFVISQGDVSVWQDGQEIARYQAPYTGITEPGTRRLLVTHADTIWTTFHVTEKTDPDEIIQEITDTEPNPLLSEEDLKRSAWRKDWRGEPQLQLEEE